MTYAEKLRDPRWQRKRLEIFARDEWRCVKCGTGEDTELHVHHKKYKGNPWDAPDDALETLCDECHRKQHAEKVAAKKKKNSGAPWFKLYASDFLFGESCLFSAAERGAFIALLCHQWIAGSLPTNRATLRRMAGGSVSGQVMALFKPTKEPGRIANADMAEQRRGVAHWIKNKVSY